MAVLSLNGTSVLIRRITNSDLENLSQYLTHLSPETKRRFGPHASDISSIFDFYSEEANTAYVAIDTSINSIIAYHIIKTGFLGHDVPRLESYGLTLNPITDCTYAPSVADAWQGLGLGKRIFEKILSELRLNGFKRIILWGGVQADNQKAVYFYKKLNFMVLGQFEYHGANLDMICNLE